MAGRWCPSSGSHHRPTATRHIPPHVPNDYSAHVSWRTYVYSLLAAEISAATRYATSVREWPSAAPGNPLLRELVEARDRRPDEAAGGPTAYLLNGTLNYSTDIEGLLAEIRAAMTRGDRVVAVIYNPYLSWLYALASRLGLRSAPTPPTFVTRTDLANLARIAGFEVVRYRPAAYVPWRLLGLGTLVNKLLPIVPLVRHTALAAVVTLRPLLASARRPSLSIVIPARNEAGNIENAISRLPDLRTDVEVLFVEGHSSDDTWRVIERTCADYRGPLKLRALRQTGRGKADAVHRGFREASGELLTILDADLTMPPELLPRFYEAYISGHADFINGSRLLYPMEGEAMRPLNRLGNIFFAKALAYVLDARIGDSLCGTKLLSKADWLRCQAWRDDFGDFDPFGDFELLFPAAILGLGIVDVPIRYRDRTYGTTNISRFRHGWMLLRMTAIGFFRIKLGRA